MTDDSDRIDAPADGVGAEEDLLGSDLRAVLSSLPRELAPERDLTQEIAARTWDSREKLPAGLREWGTDDAPATTTPPRQSPRFTGQGLKLAAAAVALVVVTSAITTLLVRDQAGATDDVTATIAETTIEATTDGAEEGEIGFAAYREIEIQYAAAIEDLTEALAAERDRLPPETVRLIEENLGIIDEAIRQSVAALEATPQSLSVQQAVVTSYERKLDFLRQAAAITAEG